MVLNRFMLRRASAIILACCIFLFLFYAFDKQSNSPTLTESVIISHEVRYTCIPLLISDEDPCTFILTIDSYEHSEVIELLPIEFSLLYDDTDSFNEPVKWEEEHLSQYKRKGVLTFPPVSKEAASITLSLFLSEEVQFKFDRPTQKQ
jgi:hypothetical protein